jgi:MFS family permease
MAFTNLAVFGGAFFTPIVVGRITKYIGWHWTFWFEAIFCAACLPLVIIFVPETAYRRSTHLNTDMASSDDVRSYPKQVETGHELAESPNSARPEEYIELPGTANGEGEKYGGAAARHYMAPSGLGAQLRELATSSRSYHSVAERRTKVSGNCSFGHSLSLLILPYFGLP